MKLIKVLLFVLVLLPTDGRTQEQVGCFVKNGAATFSTDAIQCGNFYTNVETFGEAVGSLCNNYKVAQASLDLYAEAIQREKALTAKYRRKCGAKCKNIKRELVD